MTWNATSRPIHPREKHCIESHLPDINQNLCDCHAKCLPIKAFHDCEEELAVIEQVEVRGTEIQ
jgi:hypothetical protein